MSSFVLYFNDLSNSSRAVIMLAKALKIELQLQPVDVFKHEHETESFLAINPSGSIPVLNHSGFILSQASAIAIYLATNSELYPLGVQERAFIHSRLFFYACQLDALGRQIFEGVLYKDSSNLIPELLMRLRYSLATLNKYLARSRWICGENETIVDYLTVTIVTTLLKSGFHLSEFKEVLRWYEQCKNFEGFEQNEIGAERLAVMIQSYLADTKFNLF